MIEMIACEKLTELNFVLFFRMQNKVQSFAMPILHWSYPSIWVLCICFVSTVISYLLCDSCIFGVG